MNCRRCNTPLPSRASSCPNCGQHVGAGESFIDDPDESGGLDEQTSDPLGPSMLTDSGYDGEGGGDDEELSLDDAVTPEELEQSHREDVTGAGASGVSSRPKTEPARPAARPTPRPTPAPRKPAAPASSSKTGSPAKVAPKRDVVSPRPAAGGDASEGALMPDADTVRAILAQQPELIERGLEVLTDDTGQEIGVQHATDVGVIDLLARDAKGALVAVMVVGSGEGRDVVGEALHRLGWVRKHLAKNGEDVRGVVLTEGLDDEVAYAAAAVAGTLKFKGYALSLSLVDLDV